LPAVSEPTRSNTPSCCAGLRVTKHSASAGATPPYFTALPASLLSRRACSLLSLLNDTLTPASCRIAPLSGIASNTSNL
jgi:hypothetical protein